MNIAIFGDSYAEKNRMSNQLSWFELLEEHGHQVTSFGEGGSSVVYSASLIEQHSDKFDFLIWAVTNPPRLSIQIDEKPNVLHFTQGNSHSNNKFKSVETKNKINAVEQYFKYLLDFQDQELIASALVNYMMTKHSNLMIIPCFHDPLRLDFNLFVLCEKEINYYFPNWDLVEFFETYRDMRRCHLSLENNKILADLIAKQLKPGIFQASYDDFVMNPSADSAMYFLKR